MSECNAKERLEKPRAKLALLRGGFSLHGIGTTDWRIGLFMSRLGFETYLILVGEASVAGTREIHVIGIRAPIRLPIVYTIVTALLAARQLLQLRPDILVAQPELALAGMICKVACPQTSIVLDVRSVPVEGRGLLGLIERAWFALALRVSWFDAATVITEGMLDLLDGRYRLRQRVPTEVWGSGFDEEVFLPNLDGSITRQRLGLQGKFVLMFHGSFSPSRGLDEVICCLRLLREQGAKDVRLVLIGDGSAQAHLTELATKLGVADQFILVPPVPHTDIPRWLAGADLGLDPLPDHPWWRHQSPLKVYEYLAMGVPVLATDIPCHRGISEAIILMPDNSPQTLSEAILRMKQMPSHERRRLRETALRDARQHTWSAKAKVLAEFLSDQVLGDGR